MESKKKTDDENFTITIGSDNHSESITFDTSYTYNTEGATVGGVMHQPVFTTDLGNYEDYDSGRFESIDRELIDSNPTCKALWDQFNYVYTMIKADKDNEDLDDGIPF